jgi:hypothetical protein
MSDAYHPCFQRKRRGLHLSGYKCCLKSHSLVARQMGFANWAVCAEHGSLHQTETTRRWTDVKRAVKTHVFVGETVDRCVHSKFFPDCGYDCLAKVRSPHRTRIDPISRVRPYCSGVIVRLGLIEIARIEA